MSPGRDDQPSPEQRRTMRYWLSRVMREARRQKQPAPNLADIARLARVTESTLSRWENPHLTSWPRNLDTVVAAYAQLIGIEDGRELWQRAAQRFVKEGGAPVLGELSEAQRSLLLALEVARRQSPYADESPAAPSATRRKRRAR